MKQQKKEDNQRINNQESYNQDMQIPQNISRNEQDPSNISVSQS